LAEKHTVDNGKYPHGGYRGTRKHPPCGLSVDKSREFRQALDHEVSRILTDQEMTQNGRSPSWSLVVHRQPSFSDESPLITQSFLAASKYEQTDGITLLNRTSLLPSKSRNRRLKNTGEKYYRPNRTHQYLTATELRDHSKDQVNVAHGRPTRTTLLRARTKCMSAQTNSYETRREAIHKIEDVKPSTSSTAASAEYLQLRNVREAESLHSYLTGARYNRANCLDSKSVENSGLYIPRSNTALGSIFRGPKGQEYLREFVETPRKSPPQSGRRRPTTAPQPERRPLPTATRPVWPDQKKKGRRPHPRSAEDVKRKQSKLNVVGCRLPIGLGKDLTARIATMQRQDSSLMVRSLDDTYVTSQPPPTPNSMAANTREDTIGREDSEVEEEVREEVDDVEEVEEVKVEEKEQSTQVTEEERGEEMVKEEEPVLQEKEKVDGEEKFVTVPMIVVDVRGSDDEKQTEVEVENGLERGKEEEHESDPIEDNTGEEVEESTTIEDVNVQDNDVITEERTDDNNEENKEDLKENASDENVLEDANVGEDNNKEIDEGEIEDVVLDSTESRESEEDTVEGNDKKKRIGSAKEVRFFLTEEEKDNDNDQNENVEDTTHS